MSGSRKLDEKMVLKTKKKKAIKKPKLSPEQRKTNLRKYQHIRYIKEAYTGAGFTHISSLSKTEFEFMGKKCDFDDIFVMENVLIFVEHTSHNEEHVSTHLIKKKIIFDYINHYNSDFVEYLRLNFSTIFPKDSNIFQNHHFQIKIVYASRYPLKQSTKDHVPGVYFLDYPHLKYFLTLSRAVKFSAKFEMLNFLQVPAVKFSKSALSPASYFSSSFLGSVLPESQSHFPKNHKVVSFYANASTLLQRFYVLRRDSWREGNTAYQRIVDKKKIQNMRQHLIDKKGTFVNNIIVTLPEGTKILDFEENQIDPSGLEDVTSARIGLPLEYNSIGIIDGQHRVLSYHEGGTNEDKIFPLREQQNLLVTGIIFPNNTSQLNRDRFSANLFLQINSNQARVKPELIQEIGLILKPFSVQSIARRLLKALNDHGPLANEFETAFSEGPKVKTASVVNYALTPLVRPGNQASLYHVWPSPNKENLLKGVNTGTGDEAIIDDYVKYCSIQVNTFIGAIKANIDKTRWTSKHSVQGKMLTTTIVNGMLHCLRCIANSGEIKNFDGYQAAMEEISSFDFSPYKSSHYAELGSDIALKYFKVAKVE